MGSYGVCDYVFSWSYSLAFKSYAYALIKFNLLFLINSPNEKGLNRDSDSTNTQTSLVIRGRVIPEDGHLLDAVKSKTMQCQL